MAQVQEAILDDSDVQKLLKETLRKVGEIKGAKETYVGVLSKIVFADVMSHFSKEEGEEGPWTPWSKAYEIHMGKLGKGGNRILQDTGNLRQSFLPTNTRLSSQGILWFNPAKTKSGFPYAKAHDEGGPKLPKRSYMWLSDRALEDMAVKTLGFLEDVGG